MKCVLQSCVKGYLMAKLDVPPSTKVEIQVRSSREDTDVLKTHEFVPLEDALRTQLIEPTSPYITYMMKYDIAFLEIMDDHIVGPNIGAMNLLERLLKHLQFQYMTDMSTGTGALIKVGLVNGVQNAFGYDLNVQSAKSSLSEYGQRVKLRQADLFSADLEVPRGLIIADPNMQLSSRFVSELVPRIIDNVQLLMLIHGHTEHIELNRRIRKMLSQQFRGVIPLSSFAIEASLVTNDLDLLNKARLAFADESN